MLRKSILRSLSLLSGFVATIPWQFRNDKIKSPEHVSHREWDEYLSTEFNTPGMRVLEVGSRNVTGSNRRGLFRDAEYLGFDIYRGENVDVVGDAHRLSSYFAPEDRFDLILSSAVFEHLHMPWVAAFEIQKMLKVGGHVFVETHFSFSAHQRPWNFFQFSDMGLRALFSSAIGFDLVESGMSNPIAGHFSPHADSALRYRPVTELYCHSEILCRKRVHVDNVQWSNIEMDDIVDGSRYPTPE